jgi:hypothetical protein
MAVRKRCKHYAEIDNLTAQSFHVDDKGMSNQSLSADVSKVLRGAIASMDSRAITLEHGVQLLSTALISKKETRVAHAIERTTNDLPRPDCAVRRTCGGILAPFPPTVDGR